MGQQQQPPAIDVPFTNAPQTDDFLGQQQQAPVADIPFGNAPQTDDFFGMPQSVSVPPEPFLSQPTDPFAYSSSAPQSSMFAPAYNQPANPPPASSFASPFSGAETQCSEDLPKDTSLHAHVPIAIFLPFGKLLTVFPTSQIPHAMTVSNVQHVTELATKPSALYIHSLKPAVVSPIFSEAISSFPGPLSLKGKGSSTRKSLEVYVDQHVNRLDGIDMDAACILFRLLLTLWQHNGDLHGKSESIIGSLLSGDTNQLDASFDETNMATTTQTHAYCNTSSSSIDQLIAGNRTSACQEAVNSEQWAQALIIASHTDPKMFSDVIDQFVAKTLPLTSPMRTLFLSFAGKADKLFPVSDSNNVQMQANMVQSNLHNWRKHVSILYANQSAGCRDCLLSFGSRLDSELASPNAAHICYILAGEAPSISKSSPMQLIGQASTHASAKYRLHQLLDAVHLTEMYEQAKQSHLPQFQSLKFLLGLQLLELGFVDEALGYFGENFKHIKSLPTQSKGTAFCYLFNQMFERLEHRLQMGLMRDQTQHTSIASGSSSGSISGSLFSSMINVFDKVSSKIVGPDEDVPSIPEPVHPPIQPAQPVQSVQQAPVQPQQTSMNPYATSSLVQPQQPPRSVSAPLVPSDESPTKGPSTVASRSVSGSPRNDTVKEKTASSPSLGEAGNRKSFLGMFSGMFSRNQADLGEENSFYYNEELGRYVERGKEHETQTAAAPPPPPTAAASPLPPQPPQMPTSPIPPASQAPPPFMQGANKPMNKKRAPVRARYVDTFNS